MADPFSSRNGTQSKPLRRTTVRLGTLVAHSFSLRVPADNWYSKASRIESFFKVGSRIKHLTQVNAKLS